MSVGPAALTPAKLALYGTSATVIPVFMLALAVQLRAGRIFLRGVPLVDLFGRRARPAALALGFMSLVLLVVGELVAVGALENNGDNHGHNAGWVYGAMVVGVVLVFLGTVDAVVGQIRTEDELDRQSPKAPEPLLCPGPNSGANAWVERALALAIVVGAFRRRADPPT